MIRRGLAAVTALALAALPLLPVKPASAAALPRPRSEEYWFPAWDIENKLWPLTRGAGVIVAVVDTGVNAALPGLHDVVLPGTQIGKGGDGRTDTDAYLGGHGTSMAEFIAGQGLDEGMVGVAPEAKILPIDDGNYTGNISEGIKYAADHGAKVINVSQGGADSPIGGHLCPGPASEAIAYAARKDAVVVAAAGNDGNERNDPKWPADCPGVLAVGAINGRKVPWTDTERQPYVSIAAPGIQTGSVDRSGRFSVTSGTSNAAALASGAIAMIRAKDPGLSARQVVQRVINTAIDAGPPGHDVYTGYGVMIPYKAMTIDVPASAPNPPYAALDKYLATHKQAPAGQQATSSGTSAAKKSSNSGLIIGLVVALVVVVAVILIVVLLLRGRNGRGGPGQGIQQQPFPGPPYGRGVPPPAGPPGPQGPQGPYGPGPGQPVDQGYPQGRPSFHPPTDPRGPQS